MPCIHASLIKHNMYGHVVFVFVLVFIHDGFVCICLNVYHICIYNHFVFAHTSICCIEGSVWGRLGRGMVPSMYYCIFGFLCVCICICVCVCTYFHLLQSRERGGR